MLVDQLVQALTARDGIAGKDCVPFVVAVVVTGSDCIPISGAGHPRGVDHGSEGGTVCERRDSLATRASVARCDPSAKEKRASHNPVKCKVGTQY